MSHPEEANDGHDKGCECYPNILTESYLATFHRIMEEDGESSLKPMAETIRN